MSAQPETAGEPVPQSAPALQPSPATAATSTPPAPVANESSAFQPEFRVFRPPHSADNSPQRELPDAFFQPTTTDLKIAQDSLSARTQALTNAPLRTQAMRDAETKARLAKYPTTTIRVRFADRTQLERTFPSADKIRSVYAFVRGSLREDVKPIKFVLFQTPPRRELKVSDPKVRDLTLLALQLAPTSVLHLKFENEDLNHITVPAPLAPEVLARAEDLPIPPDFDAQAASGSSTPDRGQTVGSTSGKGSGKKVTVPRWLKLGPNR